MDRPETSALTFHQDGRDPYFGMPLWLATDCGPHDLWAYNEAHLSLLESYVAANLRERGRPLTLRRRALSNGCLRG